MSVKDLHEQLAARAAQHAAAKAKEAPGPQRLNLQYAVFADPKLGQVTMAFSVPITNISWTPEIALATATNIINCARALGVKITGELKWESTEANPATTPRPH